MTKLHLTKEQTEILLDAVEYRIGDLEEYLPSAFAELDYRGDEDSLDQLKATLSHLKAIAPWLDHQLNWEN